MEFLIYECKMLFGLVIAAILGFTIGCERKYRAKGAGIRTHTIVCLGSALMMIISKYAFASTPGYDPSRIAAQIVTGIGFLGAGIIVYKRNEIKGLTTAAGVWATAGVGMAAGAELYILALGSTILIIMVQVVLHFHFKFLETKKYYRLNIEFKADAEQRTAVKEIFDVERFQDLLILRKEDGLTYQTTIYTGKEFSSEKLDKIMHDNPFILSIERYVEE